MKWLEKHANFISELIALLFILLFIYAAVSKLLEYDKFHIQISQSPILTSMGNWIAFLVPVIEILIAFFLIVPRFRLLAFYAAFCLMITFTTYIFLILKFSPFIPCACGGILDSMGWAEHLIFNLGFVSLAMIGVLLTERFNISNTQCKSK